MNVMTVSPVAPNHVTQNNEQRVVEEVVDIPQQQDAESTPNPEGEGSPESIAEMTAEMTAEAPAEPTAEPTAEVAEVPETTEEKETVEEKDEKKAAAKPKRKSAPRKAAGGTKTLVVLKDGRVQYADTDSVLVVDLDEASSPDTDVHDVLDRLTELRDAVESPGKVDAVKALTDLIQEKALG
ncbi:hypothetical protein GCM10009839_53480 [Catenulispora yoronensis]|uniref:Nascent polypeptide-associated complex subunit alpha-like UBA domain-containing protein n=1 Tax=Catenulispora yoronensis TaxID=450799 RepID=A0ABN2UU22_9ACTN